MKTCLLTDQYEIPRSTLPPVKSLHGDNESSQKLMHTEISDLSELTAFIVGGFDVKENLRKTHKKLKYNPRRNETSYCER